MLYSAMQLTIIGMLTVFTFLIFLACSISALSLVAVKFFPETPTTPDVPKEVHDELIAAVIAAIVSKK